MDNQSVSHLNELIHGLNNQTISGTELLMAE